MHSMGSSKQELSETSYSIYIHLLHYTHSFVLQWGDSIAKPYILTKGGDGNWRRVKAISVLKRALNE